MKTRHLDGVVDELMLILEIATMTDEEFDKRAMLLDQLRLLKVILIILILILLNIVTILKRDLKLLLETYVMN